MRSNELDSWTKICIWCASGRAEKNEAVNSLRVVVGKVGCNGTTERHAAEVEFVPVREMGEEEGDLRDKQSDIVSDLRRVRVSSAKKIVAEDAVSSLDQVGSDQTPGGTRSGDAVHEEQFLAILRTELVVADGTEGVLRSAPLGKISAG